MSVEIKGKVALCPHCGHDEFAVNESEVRYVRLVSAEKPPYFKVEEISSKGKGYDAVVCLECGSDLNSSEWLNSALPDSPR